MNKFSFKYSYTVRSTDQNFSRAKLFGLFKKDMRGISSNVSKANGAVSFKFGRGPDTLTSRNIGSMECF